MPIAAVAGIVAGASALATGVGIMGTISAIGGIVGGIGILTKSKELTALGAVAGLAGGVGAFAQDQGWLASSNAMDTATNAAAGSGNIDKMVATPSGAEAPSPSSVDAINGSDLASDQASAGKYAAASGLFSAEAPQTTAGLPTTADMTSQSNPLLRPDESMVQSAATNPLSASYTNTMDVASDQASAANYSLPRTNQNASVLDTIGQFGKWMEKNKVMSQIGANFIGGFFDSNKRAQTDLLRARADTEKAQLANASAVPNFGLSTRTAPGGAFNTTPATYQPVRTGGLFNAR